MTARKKVQITRNVNRCGSQLGLVYLLRQIDGFELTGTLDSVGMMFGWLPADQVAVVRSWPEVACIADDYPYLQESVDPHLNVDLGIATLP